jgi:hypothetical protein
MTKNDDVLEEIIKIDEYEFLKAIQDTCDDYLALYKATSRVIDDLELAKAYHDKIVYFKRKDEQGDFEFGWYSIKPQKIGYKLEEQG